MDDPSPPKPAMPIWLKAMWAVVLIAWFVGYIWLMSEAAYPDSFGFRLMRGRGGMIEAFVYSYLLVERHHWWDLALFVWMWSPVIGCVGWLARNRLRSWRPGRFSLFDEA